HPLLDRHIASGVRLDEPKWGVCGVPRARAVRQTGSRGIAQRKEPEMMRTWTSGLLGLGVLLATGGWGSADDQARPGRSQGHRLTKIRRAGEVIGLAVKNKSDESLGKIDDLVFSADGMCHYLIVGDGGTLGIGENYIAVPVKIVTCDEANKVARIDM